MSLWGGSEAEESIIKGEGRRDAGGTGTGRGKTSPWKKIRLYALSVPGVVTYLALFIYYLGPAPRRDPDPIFPCSYPH
jgi:hypothetical protein